VHCQVLNAHSANQMRRDAFSIDHGFIGRHIELQVLLVNSSEGAQEGAERRSCPFTGVAMDLASAVPIIISGPFVDAMADGSMGGMAAAITLPCIRVQDRTMPWDILSDQVSTCAPVRVVAPPKTLFARLA
jgi:hypothetical protein